MTSKWHLRLYKFRQMNANLSTLSSPDKKTMPLIVEADYMRHLLSEVPLVSFGVFLGFKDIGTRRELTQRG